MKKNLLLTTALVAFAMPSWAENYNGDGSTNVNIVDKEYNYIYGSSTNPNIDGAFSLIVNETQTQRDVIGAYFKTPSQDASVKGDVILNIISSNIGLTVTGSQLQDPHGEGNVGVAGKTIVNVKNSTIGESVRGANISGSTTLIGDYSIGNIQLNVENSTVVNEIVSVGSGVSAGDIEINIKGSSSIGTSGDGWLIAGTSRNVGNSVKNTTINLNTDGAENTINVGGYVTSGSRYKDGGVGSVTGNAQLNILGGGTVNVGALNGGITVNGDSVSGTSSLDIKGTTVNVTADENFENADGSIKGFDTITMDDKSKLNVTEATNTALHIKEGTATLNNATFSKNEATEGGAIFMEAEGKTTTISSSTFSENKAASVDVGGAISLKRGNLVLDDVTFSKNEAGYGGAIFTYSAGNKLEISNSLFEENSALGAGAITTMFEAEITNTTFKNNRATEDEDGAGALFVGAEGKTKINTVTFEKNTSAARGGAISTRSADLADNKDARLDILNSTFTSNIAGTTGGALDNYLYSSQEDVTTVYASNNTYTSNQADMGGAIYNHGTADKGGKYATIEIADSTFTDNIATTSGGAIYNEAGGTVKLSGTNVFSGNTANGSANDIHNDGTLNVTGNLTLDGGITGSGDIAFENANLTATLDKTLINAGNVTITDSTLNLILGKEVATGEHMFISASSQEGVFDIENGLYTITHLDNGKINVEAKSSSEVASDLGLSSSEASALTAATSGGANSGNASFDEVVSQLNQAAQAGDSSVAKEASKLGADTNPVVASQEASSHDVLFSIVSNELNGAGGAIAEGKSSGDFFKKATAWVRGLFNKADHESTSKSAGFNSDTYGVAFGIDKELDNNVRAGFGYANSQTDIESVGRDTDVDTNSLFVYAKYKPADWYVNTMLAYSWSEYDEKKSILGVNAGAKYDVDTIALQSMYGYETKFKEYDLTPEFGFRYLHIDQDSYTDKLGSKVASNQEDVLTLVAGAKIAKDYTLDNGTILRPELKAALTYDLFDADNSANVLLANGAGYTVDGEKLDRLGFELGAKVSTFATEKTELSAGYLTRFREDYQDHTLTFDVKYNF